MATDEFTESIYAILRATHARLQREARAKSGFVMLLPSDPIPADLPDGTIIIRTTAAPPTEGSPAGLIHNGHLVSQVSGTTVTIGLGIIPVGSWMIAATSNNASADVLQNEGWVQLAPQTAAGSMRLGIWGRIKTDTDTQFSITHTSNLNHSTVILHGEGSASVASWLRGTVYKRNGSSEQSYITKAPGIPGVPVGSLTFSFSGERTSALEATKPTTTATEYLWMGHPASGIETMMVSSVTDPVTPVTVTYPNAQTINAAAITVAVTPNA